MAPRKNKRNNASMAIAKAILEEYHPTTAADVQDALKDRVVDVANEWQNRPLKKFYTFVFVDCLYVTIKKEHEAKNCAVYVVLGYDINGKKDILGIWISDSAEEKHYWMQVFDEIRSRGVEEILFISMDGVSGLEEGDVYNQRNRSNKFKF